MHLQCIGLNKKSKFISVLLHNIQVHFSSHGASADNILDTGDVAADIDEALCLVAVREVVDDAVGEEVRRHGVTTKTAHVRPQNTENFIEELLDEG